MVGKAKFVVIIGGLLLPYISAAPVDPPISETEYIAGILNDAENNGLLVDVLKNGFDNVKNEPAFQEKFREVMIEPLHSDRSHATQMRYVDEAFDMIDDKLKSTVEKPKGATDGEDKGCLTS
jgi:hypothetical protein